MIGVAAGAVFTDVNDAPQVGFVIDGGVASVFRPPNTTYSRHTDIWWASPLLDSGSVHTLDIVYLGGGNFFLDAIATGSRAGAIPVSGSAGGTTNVEISEGSHVNVGAVVGGVIGGVALAGGVQLPALPSVELPALPGLPSGSAAAPVRPAPAQAAPAQEARVQAPGPDTNNGRG